MTPAEFDELYNEYKSSVYGFACYLTRNKSEAEDLFQETWLRVTENIHKISRAKDIKAWIITVAVNLYRDELRKKRIRKMFSPKKSVDSSYTDEIFNEALWVQKSNATGETTRADLGRAISQALSNLPDKQRLVFILKEIKGFKHWEIAEILRVPTGTVKTLQHRAVKRLQREFGAGTP
jgi:RNA polymerase sigma-70 factor (ECF subfamily)